MVPSLPGGPVSLGILAAAVALADGGAARRVSAAPPAPRRDIVGLEKPLYSHAREETIVRDFFQDRRGGVFLDVGCGRPIQDSNTYFLEERLQWSGIGVDALPDMAPKWKRDRPASRFFNYIVTDHEGTEETFYRARLKVRDISSTRRPDTGPGGRPVAYEEIQIPTTTLTSLLHANGVLRIDFLSMDIEGAEVLALAGFDIDRFKPQLACIEAKPANREGLLKYFAAHNYRRVERYIPYDRTNYYFTPAGGARQR